MRSPGRRSGACILCLLLLAGGCTQTKKLSGEGDGILEGVLYGFFGMDRKAADYYRIVRESHDRRFDYRVSTHEYQVDRAVDAVQHLGGMEYERPEGEAQVVDLLAEVLLEDPSALARSSAANSLTRLALRRPRIPPRAVATDGRRLASLLRELDGLHSRGAPAGAQAERQSARLVRELGALRLATVDESRAALRPFVTRPYLTQATDPELRAALREAIVLRMDETTRLALRGGVAGPKDFVREEAMRGLKTIADRAAEPVVLERLRVETSLRVRAEAIEYLGMSGGPGAVAALLPLLEAPDPSLRLKAREALTQIAGRDLGLRRATWTRWARERYPQLTVPDAPAAPGSR